MFNNLLESKAKKQKSPGGYVVSALLHVLLIFLAVKATLNCLGHALGIAPGRTLADMREELRDGACRPLSMSSAEWFALQGEDARVEHAGFDLLTMGNSSGAPPLTRASG